MDKIKPRYALRHPNHCTYQELSRCHLSKCGKYVAISLDPINPYEHGTLWKNEEVIVFSLGETKDNKFYGVALNHFGYYHAKATWWYKRGFRPIRNKHIRMFGEGNEPFYHIRPVQILTEPSTGEWMVYGGFKRKEVKEVLVSWYPLDRLKAIVV